MRKLVLSLMGVILLFSIGGFTNIAQAEENVAEYDMTQGGTQQFTILDDNQEEITITVEEQENLSRAVKNGTYRITSEKAGSWKASYEIVVSSNTITTAKNPNAVALTGSFISEHLKVDTSKQATYYLTKRVGWLVNDIIVRSTLSGDKIVVSN